MYATLLGMCIVDSYLLYKVEWAQFNQLNTAPMPTFLEFVDKLTYQMIFYCESPDATQTRAGFMAAQSPTLAPEAPSNPYSSTFAVLFVLGLIFPMHYHLMS